MADWQERGVVAGDGPARTVPLDDVARAMTVHSDNAAADDLLDRVDPGAVDAFGRQQGLARRQPLGPFLGEFLAWADRTPATWAALSPSGRAATAQRLAKATTGAEAAATRRLPGLAALRRDVDASVAGTPADWARLMARIALHRGIPPAARAVIRRHLEWPLERPANRTVFIRFGTKGGGLPGVVTEATYMRPAAGRPGGRAVPARSAARRRGRSREDLRPAAAHRPPGPGSGVPRTGPG